MLTYSALRIILALNQKKGFYRLTIFYFIDFSQGANPQCFCNVIGEREMPVYEYECQECDKVFEVQQKIADAPLSDCPECQGPVKKLVSMSSFQLKGGGWYADGYASSANGAGKNGTAAKPAEAAAPCQTGAGCAGCPAATSA